MNERKHEITNGDTMRANEVMTDRQRALSEARRRSSESLERMNISGYLDWYHSMEGEVTKQTLVGELKGHEVNLNFSMGEGVPYEYAGTLDGVVLDAEDAMKLWKKYFEVATDMVKLNAARDEVGKYDVKESLKELL